MTQQQHMDIVSPRDASFLHEERQGTHMHIGAVAIFEGPAPRFSDLLAHVSRRLALVPRYRQKIVPAPLGVGPERWIDDPYFRLDYHVRQAALPPPGDAEALRSLAARIFSQRLDRHKPLWELRLVEALAGDRFAILSKTHQALVDGVDGADILTVIFDSTQVPMMLERERWIARPEPSPMQLAAATLQGWAKGAATITANRLNVRRAVSEAGQLIESAAGLADVIMKGPTKRPLSAHPSGHRAMELVPSSLSDHVGVKNEFGTTVNDVVLSAIAGGLRSFFAHRGADVDQMHIRACVPVSTEPLGLGASLVGPLAQVIVDLPVHIGDPAERLMAVTTAMRSHTTGRGALPAQQIAAAADFAPPTILAYASRLSFATHRFDLLITNVPGPQGELSLLGHTLDAIYPVPFLVNDQALAIGVVSYHGGLYYGLLGDYDEMSDLVVLAESLTQSLEELFALVPKPAKAKPATKRKTTQ